MLYYRYFYACAQTPDPSRAIKNIQNVLQAHVILQTCLLHVVPISCISEARGQDGGKTKESAVHHRAVGRGAMEAGIERRRTRQRKRKISSTDYFQNEIK